jgi:hypothetical protein
VLGAFVASSPGAKADVPPGSDCATPATPGTGVVNYKILVTLPTAAPANANGVCVTLDGTTRTAQLVTNAPGCVATPVAPTPNAGNSYVSANWGSVNCVKPGDTVALGFYGASASLAVGTVTWNLANVTPVGTGTPTATPFPGTGQIVSVVGGVAELPDSNGSLPASAESSGSSAPIYALFAGILLVAVAAAGVGWYARRRRLS